MNIIFISKYYYPHIGGVEKHVKEIGLKLKAKDIKITVITEKYNEDLKSREKVEGIKILRFPIPKAKYLGLLFVWLWFLKNINLFKKADLVHAHDVAIWYLPLRVILPHKPFYTTFHGWEGEYPILYQKILVKRLSALLSDKVICVGNYIEKYYGIKSDLVVYGAVSMYRYIDINKKKKNTLVFLGRLDKDTSVDECIKFVRKHKLKAVFCGDGPKRSLCEQVGKVYGFIDPSKILTTSEYCWAGGYLAAMEAMNFKSKTKVGWNSPIRRDYWHMTPFYKWIKTEDTKSAYNWVKTQTWRKLSIQYLNLWGFNDLNH